MTGIDLRRHVRPGDTVVVEQSTAEPRALVEALIEQRAELAPLRLIIGASFAGLVKPEHTDAFELIGLGGVGRAAVLTPCRRRRRPPHPPRGDPRPVPQRTAARRRRARPAERAERAR